MSIGIIDSGAGGLSVVKHLGRSVGDIFYFADVLYAPYGEKDSEFLINRILSIVSWMRRRNVDRVLLACHTASYVVHGRHVPRLQSMLSATVRSILKYNVQSGLVVLCTSLSARFHYVLEKFLRSCHFNQPIFFVPCPGLSDLIEQGMWSEAVQFFHEALQRVKEPFDGIVYGCTHYALLHPYLSDAMQSCMINPGEHITDASRHFLTSLAQDALAQDHSPRQKIHFYCTKKDHDFRHHIHENDRVTYVSEEQLACAHAQQKQG